MKGLPFQRKGVLHLSPASKVSVPLSNWKKNSSCRSTEPTSVLDTRRSPSPPTSTSTFSSSLGGGGGTDTGNMAAVTDNDLQPLPASMAISGDEKSGLGMEDWENNEQSFFRWFAGDLDEPSLKNLLQSGGGSEEFESVDPRFGFEGLNAPLSASDFGSLNGNGNRLISIQNPTHISNLKVSSCIGSNDNGILANPIFNSSDNNRSLSISLPPSIVYQQIDEKPQVFSLQHLLSQQQGHSPQNPPLILPLSHAQQEHHLLQHPTIVDTGFQVSKTPFFDSGQEQFLRPQQQQQLGLSNLHLLSNHSQFRQTKPRMVGTVEDGSNLQQQALVNQLFKAAELVENGDSINARGILARLNHQLSPVGKSLYRAAFYFKEALQLLLDNSLTPRSPHCSPLDVVFKISAYKAFSEVSPFVQFVNFTSNQVLLEALDGFDRIHIIDFDIGLGGQWASFMQELALRVSGAPSLRITAFASPSSNTHLELGLARENLSHFANDLGIPFQFNFVNMDSLDLSSTQLLPSLAILNCLDNEVVAVNLPIGASSPSVLSLLRLVKQLSPKIVLSVDRGCDRSELPFSHHFLNSLQSYSVLLDSLDAVNVNSDAMQKIEKFILQPRIESIVLERHRAANKMPPWRTLFASAGFSPLPFSNFTEMQAEYLVTRLQVRGFHVEKRQASLCLCWQRAELVSVSAWRC